jgi:hypothetical protein
MLGRRSGLEVVCRRNPNGIKPSELGMFDKQFMAILSQPTKRHKHKEQFNFPLLTLCGPLR